MLYASEYSDGLNYYRTNNLTTILHLVSIIVMLSLFLARDKILLKQVSFLRSIRYLERTIPKTFFVFVNHKHI
jgi:hypothetical protein